MHKVLTEYEYMSYVLIVMLHNFMTGVIILLMLYILNINF